jgi:acetyl esterase/lipase
LTVGLDPFYAARFARVRDITWDDVYGGDAEAIRCAIEFGAPVGGYVPPPTVDVGDVAVPGPHGDIPVRVYRLRASETLVPALVWMHGGAFKWGDLDMLEAHAVSAELAIRAGVVVVSVDYRLVPKYRYPVPLDECLAVARWVRRTSDAVGAGHSLAVGGASAGGNLAAAVALRARDEGDPELHAVLLAYPALHHPIPEPSPEVAALCSALPPLARFTDPRAGDDHVRDYLGEAFEHRPAYGLPGLADLRGLPPFAIANAEYDDLRPSGETFTDQLRRDKVVVDAWTEPGTVHGYLNLVGAVVGASATLDRFTRFLRRHLF